MDARTYNPNVRRKECNEAPNICLPTAISSVRQCQFAIGFKTNHERMAHGNLRVVIADHRDKFMDEQQLPTEGLWVKDNSIVVFSGISEDNYKRIYLGEDYVIEQVPRVVTSSGTLIFLDDSVKNPADTPYEFVMFVDSTSECEFLDHATFARLLKSNVRKH